jgi:Protein of unknown function (DUF1592)/Protein of unknown function (DUF1588)/Protein of unknown function (DUF1595)/Protein of unknown function (DUF1585)
MKSSNWAGISARAACAALLVGVLPGCTASVEGDKPAGSAAAVGGGGGSAGAPPFPMTSSGEPQGAGPRPLMRLTRRQYVNAAKELLGSSALPEAVSRFTPEAVSESGFVGVLPAVATIDARGYLEAAEDFVKGGAAHLAQLSTCAPGVEQADCAKGFVQKFAGKAYRRPLEPSEIDELVAVYTQGRTVGYDYDQAIALVAQAVLQSPFFLYRWELGAKPAKAQDGHVALNGHEMASRLSFGIWGSLPDQELARAADAGELASPGAVAEQARRLLADVARTSDTLWDFYAQWVFVKPPASLTDQLKKNPELFPEFDDALREAMIGETRGFLERAILIDSGSLGDLSTARWSLVDQRLASLYGVTSTAASLTRTELPATERSGLFTQPLFLAALSSDGGTLPPRMGKTIWTRMLCGPMAAIPADVPLPAAPTPGVTTRERFSLHAEGSCKGCHNILDPLGFAFENYDAIGRYRTLEGNRAVDASGQFDLPSGKHLVFQNAVELLSQLAESEDFSRCFSEQWLRYALGRPLVAADAGTPASVHDAFKASGLNIKELLVTALSSKAFMYRTVAEGEVVQ